MSSLKNKLDSLADFKCVCRVCQNDFEPPNVDSIFCDNCERWLHVQCSDLNKYEFNFYKSNKDNFYCKDCVKEYDLVNVGNDEYCKICYKKFSSSDECLYCDGCFMWMHHKCSTACNKSLVEMSENGLPFFCKSCEIKKTACYKCKLPCRNLKNHLSCFLCSKRCHVECATEKNIKLSEYKKGIYKFYCYDCENTVFPFQSVNNSDFDCFSRINKSTSLKREDECYLDLNNVKFGNKNSISVVYMNIRSLNANVYKIEEFLNSVEGLPDVICVCETWLTSMRPFIGKLKGYEFVNRVSNSNQSGGVAFFVKNCLDYEVVEDMSFNQCDVDDLWINVKLGNSKCVTIGNVYRHPSSVFALFEKNFLHVLDFLNERKKDYVIGGDVNINLLKCDRHTIDYLNCISSVGVKQFVNSPTRYSADFSSNSLIDHVYSNIDFKILNVGVVNYDVSDHMPVVCEIICEKTKTEAFNQKYIQDFSTFDVGVFLNNLRMKLKNMSLYAECSEGVNKCWDEFEAIFSGTVYYHAPIKVLNKKEQKLKAKPWLTKGIINSINNKNLMFKFAIKDKQKKFSVSFKKYRNLLNRVIELAKRLYFKQIVKYNKGNSKKLWNIVNNIVSTKSTSSCKMNGVLDESGTIVSDLKRITDLMNKNFVNIAEKLLNERKDAFCNNLEFCFSSVCNDFVFKEFTISEIEMYIKSMKPNKSVRSDVPSIRFVKLSSKVIAPYLCELFNKCVEYGVFPESLKYAEVVPIYKSGKKCDVNNYRPISLLSPFSKIFESLVCERLNNFFLSNDVLHKRQYGFRKNSTTELAVNQIVNELTEAGEKKLVNCSVFFDLAKAFNTVNHKILLSKLKGYNVKGSMLNFLKSYLKNRSQSIVINNVVSKLKVVNVGIPQGSCLGPLLFLVYMVTFFLLLKSI